MGARDASSSSPAQWMRTRLVGGVHASSATHASPAVSGVPSPPTDVERVLYVEPGPRLLLHAPPVLGLVLSLGMLAFCLGHRWAAPVDPWFALTSVYWLSNCWLTAGFKPFDLRAHDALMDRTRDVPAPSIDVFVATCGEPLELLANTFSHVAAMRHDGPLRLVCLDDGSSPEVASLCAGYGFEYLARPNPREMGKSGNLKYGYERTDGDFIVIFDADFCPRPDFLSELLPYALDDPSVGIVQSPQYFHIDQSQNWLQNGAASVLEAFYRVFQQSRESRRCPICVGTCAVYRRSALEVTNGFAHIQFGEDMHTGFDLMCAGYQTRYVPVILASGLCPTTLGPLLSQQYRWCRGSSALLASRKFWRRRLDPRVRLTFLTGCLFYVQSGLGLVLLPLPAIVMVWVYPQHIAWWSCLLFIPILHQLMSFFGYGRRTPASITGLRVVKLSAWAHLLALRDTLRGRTLIWAPTGAATAPRRGLPERLMRRLAIGWGLLCGAGLMLGAIVHMPGALAVDFWPIIIFAAINLATSLAILIPLRSTVSDASPPPWIAPVGVT